MIKQSGLKPYDDLNHTYDELFLCFASAFGIKEGTTVHRKAIFNYIQTHKTAKTESSLQGKLEKSDYWIKEGNAYYTLNHDGENKLRCEYDTNNSEIKIYPIVRFSVNFKNYKISEISFPNSTKYRIYLDGNEVKADQIFELLSDFEIHLNDYKTSKPREVLSWIFSQNNYEWEILNYKELIAT